MNTRRTAYLAYLSLVTLLGAAVTLYSAYRIVIEDVGYQWLILAYLTVLTGAFTMIIPGINSRLSVSDAIIFINTILFGTAAGALTAALDGCMASLRLETASRRRRATPFNTAAMGISAFAAGEVFFRQFAHEPLARGSSTGILGLVLPLILSALVYYICNSFIVAGMVALDSGVNMLRIWQVSFQRIWLISWVSAAAGALVAFAIRSITPAMLLVVVPILVLLYLLDKFYLGPDPGPPIAADNDPVSQRPPHRRYHYFVVTLGIGFIILLVRDVLADKVSQEWLILASLTVCAGFITVQIPGIRIKVTLADTFVFANAILFGPVVGGITAALDGLAGSLRCKTKSRRLDFALFNMAAMALSAYAAGLLFFRVLRHGALYQAEKVSFGATFLPALVFAISYYLLNALGVAIIVALQTQSSVFRVWRENLLWGLVTYIACAFGAVFISAGILAITPDIAAAVLLLLAAVYFTCRAFAERVSGKIRSS